MPNDKIPPRKPKASAPIHPQAQSLEYVVARLLNGNERPDLQPFIEEIGAWWGALGEHDELQSDLARARAWAHAKGREEAPHDDIDQLGIWPNHVALGFSTRATLARTVMHAALAGQWLRRRYPNLTMYSPNVATPYVYQAVEWAITLSWEQGLAFLLGTALRMQSIFGPPVRTELWRVRWESGNERFAGHFVPAEAAAPILVECLQGDPGMVHEGADTLGIMIYPALNVSKEEFAEACEQARQRFLERSKMLQQELSLRQGLRPAKGPKKGYFYMVKLYKDWCRRGKLEPIGRGLNGDRYAKELLGQAREWLEPEDVEDNIFA